MKDVRGEERSSAVKVIITTTMIIISPSGVEAASASCWHNDELRSRLSGSRFSFFPVKVFVIAESTAFSSSSCSLAHPSSLFSPYEAHFPVTLPLPAVLSLPSPPDYHSPPSSTPSTPSPALIKNWPPGSDPSCRSPR